MLSARARSGCCYSTDTQVSTQSHTQEKYLDQWQAFPTNTQQTLTVSGLEKGGQTGTEWAEEICSSASLWACVFSSSSSGGGGGGWLPLSFFCLIWSQEWLSKRERQEVWSIVFGGRGVGLRAALEPLELVVIYSVTSLLSLWKRMSRQHREVCVCVSLGHDPQAEKQRKQVVESN